jgi:hypothetical protein
MVLEKFDVSIFRVFLSIAFYPENESNSFISQIVCITEEVHVNNIFSVDFYFLLVFIVTKLYKT